MCIRLLLCVWVVVATLSNSLPLQAQNSLPPKVAFLSNWNANNGNSFFSYIDSDSILEVELFTDMKLLIENKKKDEYQAATIRFFKPDGQPFERDVKIKARGKSRRNICDFPPVKLKFAKDDLLDAGFTSQFNKLKLVTHCFSSKGSEEKLLKEYLAYKLYNQLTDISYRVQLVRIRYLDTKNKFKPFDKYAFFIENSNELAHRLTAERVEQYNVRPIQMNSRQHLLLALFQYMIGNTDWRIDLMHNLKLLRTPSQQGLVAVPYDFDFSGLVNNKYAIPNPDLGTFSVRDRVFQGACPDEKEMTEVLAFLKEKKSQLISLCEKFDVMHKKERKDAAQFIKSFYEEIEDIEQLKALLAKACSMAEAAD